MPERNAISRKVCVWGSKGAHLARHSALPSSLAHSQHARASSRSSRSSRLGNTAVAPSASTRKPSPAASRSQVQSTSPPSSSSAAGGASLRDDAAWWRQAAYAWVSSSVSSRSIAATSAGIVRASSLFDAATTASFFSPRDSTKDGKCATPRATASSWRPGSASTRHDAKTAAGYAGASASAAGTSDAHADDHDAVNAATTSQPPGGAGGAAPSAGAASFSRASRAGSRRDARARSSTDRASAASA